MRYAMILLVLFAGCRSAEIQIAHKPSGLRVTLKTRDNLGVDNAKLVVR